MSTRTLFAPLAFDDPFRYFTTDELLRERRIYRRFVAEIDADPEVTPFAANTRDVYALRLDDIERHIERHKRLMSDADRIEWCKREPAELEAEIDEIKTRLDLGDFVQTETGAILLKRGTTYWAPCPLPGHEEHTASFHVDPDKQVWHCFGCGRGGDLFEFARQLYSIGEFWRVVEILREKAGLPTPVPKRATDRPATPKPPVEIVTFSSGVTFAPMRAKGGRRVG